MGNGKILIIIIFALFTSDCMTQTDAWIRKRRIDADTTITIKVLQLPAGSYNTATLNAAGDSVRVFVVGGMNANAKILVSWHGTGFLGELGIRNRSPAGFTIFSNTDELYNIEIIYLILDHKITLP